MNGDTPEKKSVRLSIFNQTFTLLVSGDPESILRAANEIDDLMTKIARSGNVDTTKAAILACLHLQDRIYELEQELTGVKERVAGRTRELASLLDSTLDTVVPPSD